MLPPLLGFANFGILTGLGLGSAIVQPSTGG